MPMDRPGKFLALGLAVAALTLITGKLIESKLQSDVFALIAQCNAENQRNRSAPGPAWNRDPLVCAPESLQRHSGDVVGIQAEIVRAARKADRAWDVPLTIALAAGIVGALPYTWYFLLRRIRELRDAIIGR